MLTKPTRDLQLLAYVAFGVAVAADRTGQFADTEADKSSSPVCCFCQLCYRRIAGVAIVGNVGSLHSSPMERLIVDEQNILLLAFEIPPHRYSTALLVGSRK